MDVNYHTNRIIAHRSPGGYFVTPRVKRRLAGKSGKKTVSRKRKSTTPNRGSSQKTASNKRSRNDFFTSIVDTATR